MKKTLALVLAFAMLVMMIPTSAIELSGVEAMNEYTDVPVAELTENAELFAEGTIPAKWDNTYGQLVYFNDGVTEYTATNLTMYVGTATELEGEPCFRVSALGGAWKVGVKQADGQVWKWNDGTVMSGTLTFIADYNKLETTPNGYGYGMLNDNNPGDGGTNGDNWGRVPEGADATNGWISANAITQSNMQNITPPSKSTITENGVVNVVYSYANGNDKLYYDNLRVYVKSDNQVYFKADAASELSEQATITGDTYVLPSIVETLGNSYAEYDMWTDGTNYYYEGSSIDKAKAVCKQFYPAKSGKPAILNSTYGQLVYWSDFTPNKEAYSPTGIKVLNGTAKTVADEPALFHAGSAGSYRVSFGQGANIAWTWSDGTPMTGKVTMTGDYYCEGTTIKGGYQMVNDKNPGDNGTQNIWSAVHDSTAELNKWHHLLRNPYQDNIENLTFWNIAVSNGTNGSTGMYYDNIAIYVLSNDIVYFAETEDSEKFIQRKITGDTMILPEFTEIFPDSNANFWTDGTKYYSAGDSVAKADIINKLLYPVTIEAYKNLKTWNPAYGEVIYFSEYTGEGAEYSPLGLKTSGTVTANVGGQSAVYRKIDNFNQGTRSVSIYNVSDGQGKSQVWMDGDSPLAGEVRMIFDYYVPSGITTNWVGGTIAVNDSWYGSHFEKALHDPDFGSYNYDNWVRGVVRNKTWTFDGVNSTIKSIAVSAASEDFYLDNVYVYVKRANVVYLVTDSTKETLAAKETVVDGYTFPLLADVLDTVPAKVNAWTDGTKTYLPGETANKADIAGKIFYPTWKSVNVTPTPAEKVDDNLGVLVAFFNMDSYLASSSDNYRFPTYYANSNFVPQFDTNVEGERVVSPSAEYSFLDNKAYKVPAITYPLGIRMDWSTEKAPDGKQSFRMKVLVPENAADSKLSACYNNDGSAWDGTLKSVVADANANKGTWVTYERSVNITTTGEEGPMKKGTQQITFYGASGETYIDDIEIWNFPADGYVLTDINGVKTMNRTSGAEKVTLPELPAGYVWTDRENLNFEAGAEANSADVVGKAIYPRFVSAEVDATTKQATYGGTNAIRFTSYTDYDLTATVSKIGFIVSRESIITYLGKTNEDLTHDLALGLEKAYVEGFSFNKDEDVDIVFEQDVENSRDVRTFLVTGIPDDYKDEIMVARPFTVLNIGGTEVTVYGKVIAQSYNGSAASGTGN